MSGQDIYVTVTDAVHTPDGLTKRFRAAGMDDEHDCVHFYMPDIDGVDEVVVGEENLAGIVYGPEGGRDE